MNSLWTALNPGKNVVRSQWHPSPEDVAKLRLMAVTGLGKISVDVVHAWLLANGIETDGVKKERARITRRASLETLRQEVARLSNEVESLKAMVRNFAKK